MKQLLSGLALAFCALCACAQSDDEIVAARVQTFDRGGIPQTHPRLLLTQKELPALRAWMASLKGDGAAIWQKIRVEPGAVDIPAEPEALPAKKSGSNPEIARLWREGYDTANKTGNYAWRFALQYLVSGDEKYGREAARWLLALSDWRADRVALRNNDEQFIQATRPMIFAYDWAYDALTPAERSKIEKTLLARIQLLNQDQKKLFFLTRPTAPSSSLSHPMRFISTVGQGGLALYHEQPEAKPLLAWAFEYYQRQFPVWGGADGGWAEGLEYWSSGLTQHLRFLDAMKQLGFDEPLQRGFFANNAYFGVYNLMPYAGSSFGDLTNLTKPDPNRALLLEKFALLNRDPYPLAFSRQLASRYPDDLGYYTFNAIDSLLHLWRKDQLALPDANLADLSQSRYFADIGWVAMHSRLGDKDRDIMLTLKSSPFGSASHSHNDQNAFVINAFGEPLAIQSGYRDWYDSAHHTGWTRLTKSKNAILINGEGQPSKSASATGKIARHQAGAGFDFTTGDASAAYSEQARRALRHVFFVDRRYFVMLDEIAAREPATFQWLLHARERMDLDTAAGQIVSRKGQAALQVALLEPAPKLLDFSQTDEFTVPVNAAFQKGRPNEWHTTVGTRKRSETGEFFTVLYPYPASENAPAISRLTASKGFAAKVGSDLVLVAREDERQVRAGDSLLDGLAASVSATTFTLIEARALRAAGLDIAASQPVTLEGRREGERLTLQLQAHGTAEIKIRQTQAPISVSGATGWRFEQGVLTLQVGDNARLVEIRNGKP